MAGNRIVRRVNKKVYDRYNYSDYNLFSDNLNPINPTQLEGQYDEILSSVQKKIVNAYEKAKVEVPEEIFKPSVSPKKLLSSLDDLANKLKAKNPLKNIQDTLGTVDSAVVVPFITAGLKNMTGEDDSDTDDTSGPGPGSGPKVKIHKPVNPPPTPAFYPATGESPLYLDCMGITRTLTGEKVEDVDTDTTTDDAGTTNTDATGTTENTGIGAEIKITYIGLNETDLAKYPATLLASECPYLLVAPSGPGSNGKEAFKGWFFDEMYSNKVVDNKLEYPGQDITIWAFFSDYEEDEDGEDVPDYTPVMPTSGEADSNCDLIELETLRIILVIIQVSKLFIKILTIALNIAKAVADIAKDAQLCWVNPPSLQSLISYVMQRLSAIIFQVLGMLLLKLWGMLNLDCISSNSLNLIAEINALLAGLTDVLGSVDDLAISFNEASGLWQTIKDAIKDLKDEFVEKAKETWDSVKDIRGQLQAAGVEIAETYTNPKTYLAAVPDEISKPIIDNINAVKDIKKNITQLNAAISALSNRDEKTSNKVPKGTEVFPV